MVTTVVIARGWKGWTTEIGEKTTSYAYEWHFCYSPSLFYKTNKQIEVICAYWHVYFYFHATFQWGKMKLCWLDILFIYVDTFNLLLSNVSAKRERPVWGNSVIHSSYFLCPRLLFARNCHNSHTWHTKCSPWTLSAKWEKPHLPEAGDATRPHSKADADRVRNVPALEILLHHVTGSTSEHLFCPYIPERLLGLAIQSPVVFNSFIGQTFIEWLPWAKAPFKVPEFSSWLQHCVIYRQSHIGNKKDQFYHLTPVWF